MRIPPHSLLTRSLREKPWGKKVSRILAAALAGADPTLVIQTNLRREGSRLVLPDHGIDLDDFSRITLLSIGKAALPMALSMEDLIGSQLAEGHILTKQGKHKLPARKRELLRIYVGGHPVPDEAGQQATADILSQLSSLQDDDLVIVLISGGCSALFTSPAEGLSLADLQRTNQILLSCGADIREINTIRKHLSRVKGGQLAKFLHPAHILTLILSDVIGDQIDLIGSGPTAPDSSTFADALDVIESYHLEGDLPDPVIAHLNEGRRGSHPETPKPGDPCFKNVTNLVLANNQEALKAGAAQAEAEGFSARILPGSLLGEASSIGKLLAEQLADMALKDKPFPRPACLIAGGETTVTLAKTRESGRGGRNLEVALSALPILHGLENIALVTLATDGEDGETDAAGAVVTGQSFTRCQQLGLKPEEFLKRHDSYTLFKSLDDLLLPGPTGTNVNDLCFLFTL